MINYCLIYTLNQIIKQLNTFLIITTHFMNFCSFKYQTRKDDLDQVEAIFDLTLSIKLILKFENNSCPF